MDGLLYIEHPVIIQGKSSLAAESTCLDFRWGYVYCRGTIEHRFHRQGRC